MDPLRPILHATVDGWLNDVIPWVDREGRAHVMFDHDPHRAAWQHRSYWGHVVSENLFRWHNLPPAFGPGPEAYDVDGCWTGAVVESEGTYFAFYTAQPGQSVALATSTDGHSWNKVSGNPVVPPEIPEGYGPCYRDPMVWREQESWRLVLGSAIAGEPTGALLAFSSPDLLSWTFDGEVYRGNLGETGTEFECPDLFPIGDAWVLLTSSGKTWAHIGKWNGASFRRTSFHVTDAGESYAAKTLVWQGRRVLFAWIRESRPDAEVLAAGWGSAISLPRELSIANGQLQQWPARELRSLRADLYYFADRLTVNPSGAPLATGLGPFEIELRDVEAPGLVLEIGDQRIPVASGELARIFVDRSVIEAFVDGSVLTRRTYPIDPDTTEIVARSSEPLTVGGVSVWRLAP
jgi:beta-fructofuranosidase